MIITIAIIAWFFVSLGFTLAFGLAASELFSFFDYPKQAGAWQQRRSADVARGLRAQDRSVLKPSCRLSAGAVLQTVPSVKTDFVASEDSRQVPSPTFISTGGGRNQQPTKGSIRFAAARLWFLATRESRCAWCGKIKRRALWRVAETSGICPACFAKVARAV